MENGDMPDTYELFSRIALLRLRGSREKFAADKAPADDT
jgi:hypothetical protein